MAKTEAIPAKPIQVWLIPCFDSQVGREIAERVLKSGDIAVVPAGPLASRLLDQYPETSSAVDLDPKNKGLCYSAAAAAIERWGRIDVLVNYSPTKIYVGALEEMENWQLQDQLEVSLYSCMNNIHAVLPSMLERKSGHIINVVDINGILATPGIGLLTTAVRALEGYSESLALTVFEKNVKVTVVECALEVSVGTNPLVLPSHAEAVEQELEDEEQEEQKEDDKEGEQETHDEDTEMDDNIGENYGNHDGFDQKYHHENTNHRNEHENGKVQNLPTSSAPEKEKTPERLAAKFYSKSSLCGESKSVFSRINVFPKQPFKDAVHAVIEVAGIRNPPGRIAAGLIPSSQIREYLSAMSDDLDDFDPDARNSAE